MRELLDVAERNDLGKVGASVERVWCVQTDSLDHLALSDDAGSAGTGVSDVVEVSVAATVKDGEGNLELKAPLRSEIARCFGAGEDVTITVRAGEEPKTRRQERGFHAMIQPWAKAEGHRIDDLKLDLLGEIFGWSEAKSPLSGRMMPIEMHTSTLSKKKYSELIERTLEIAAGCNFVLKAPDEWRREQEEAAERRQQAAKRERKAVA